MTNIIFADTRHNYHNWTGGWGSYTDFWKLVELSGFPTCYVDEIDTASDNVYIFAVKNGEITGWPSDRARVIHWNLEQFSYEPTPGVSETWVSDAAFAAQGGGKYVLMGSHDGLVMEDKIPPVREFDVIPLSYMTHRRQVIVNRLTNLGLKVAPNGWDEIRHFYLRASSAMLHIHQNDDKPYVAPQRFALAAAYKLPVISEMLADRGCFGYSNVLTSDFANLAEFTQMWTCRNEHAMLEDYGLALHSLLCKQYTFRKCVEAAL